MTSAFRYALFTLLPLLLFTFTHARPSEISFTPRSPPSRPITVRHYTLNITTSTLYQSCEPFGPTTITNSSLPGPTLRARAGEILSVRVYNSLDPNLGGNGGNLTMHFHGLSMKMHPVMDGTMMLSQWPIQPGQYFDYRIPLTAEDKGTYFYHSHVGVQAMTAYGGLVVEDPETDDFVDPSDASVLAEQGQAKFVDKYGDEGLGGKGKSGKRSPYQYDEDRVLALGDWFSYSSTELVQKQLAGDPFVWPGSATKLLFNGKSVPATAACNQTKATLAGQSCSDAPSKCAEGTEWPTIQLDYDKTYRLRFIGATSLMYVSAAILKPVQQPYSSANASGKAPTQPVGMATMTLIEADGSYLDALDTNHVELTTGQRYSTLYKSRSARQVQKDGTGGVYWMRVESRWRAGPSMWVKIVYPSAAASTPTPPLSLFTGQKDLQLLPAETFGWITSSLSPLSRTGGPSWWYNSPMPSDSEVTRTVVIDTQQVKFYPSAKGVKWFEDGEHFNETSPPTAQPYLVRTFLGDISFPTPSQFSTAMYNPTTYTINSTTDPIVDTANATELDAARARKWAQGYDANLNMFFAMQNEVIDIVIVNKPSQLSSSVEIHPWHMHSHKHFSRTTQPGTFSFARLNDLYSSGKGGYEHPIQRDTTIAYASPGAAYLNQTVSDPSVNDGGFTVLRYKVDPKDAGVFFLHCHIQFHLEMGMATVWTIAPEQLANRTGIYWPTQEKNVNGGKQTVQGLGAEGYLEFGKSAEAVF